MTNNKKYANKRSFTKSKKRRKKLQKDLGKDH